VDSLPENSELTAVVFLSNFIDIPAEELVKLDITIALSQLLIKVVSDTVTILNSEQENRTLH
tara:strand:+ start:1432 stop:1617 length:186 start_codon:yes stop_codon:yes gene_type:complete